MLGLLVQLALSWILIWFLEGKSLSVLGFRPTRQRLLHFALFFFITAFICASGFLLKIIFGNQAWKVNPLLSAELLFKGISWTMISVLFEELIFRGVLLYILMKRTGAKYAIAISAIAFGIYHWFSFGIIGNLSQMAIVFFITGAMGGVLAYGYAKTLSVYVPVGIHFGWNLTQMFVFSQGPIGEGILIQDIAAPFRSDSYLIYFVVTFIPVGAALLVNYILITRVDGKKRGRFKTL